MSDFKVNIPKDSINIDGDSLNFEIYGDKEYGLDKTIVNGIRRTLLASLPSVAFRTSGSNPDLKMDKNNTSLHNEFLLHRISMIPLYIDYKEWKKNKLFKLHVKNDSNMVRSVTADDFEIYNLKQSILAKCTEEGDFSMLDKLDISNYDLENPISKAEKEKIFRPFKFDTFTEYCLITELPSNQSKDNIPEIELYGCPSISTCNEDVRWQPVSCSTYSFKKDEALFDKIVAEKMIVNNISPENADQFRKELYISESERYFHRDINNQPYWYNFRIDSQNYYPPNKSDLGDGLLVQACNLLIKTFDGIKNEFENILKPDTESIMDFKKLNSDNDLVYKIIVTGGDDTIGSILQSHISNKLISEESILSLCGYKKLHPLEEVITFTLSLNTNNNIVKMDNIQKKHAIVQEMIKGCNEVSLIYQKINEECKKV